MSSATAWLKYELEDERIKREKKLKRILHKSKEVELCDEIVDILGADGTVNHQALAGIVNKTVDKKVNSKLKSVKADNERLKKQVEQLKRAKSSKDKGGQGGAQKKKTQRKQHKQRNSKRDSGHDDSHDDSVNDSSKRRTRQPSGEPTKSKKSQGKGGRSNKTHQNATILSGQKKAYSPFPSMSNMAFHDLTINQSEPTSSRTTLGLGLKFSSPKSKIKPAIDIFERRVKLSVFYAGEEGEAPNTKLRVASKWTPPAAMMPPQVINRLAAFHHSLLSLYKRRKGTPNISNSQRRRLRQLKHDQNIIAVNCDKNLGLARRERSQYVQDMFDFHLRDTSTYERLPRAQANAEEVRIREEIGDWIDTYAGALRKEVVTYLTQRLAKNVDTPFSFVYQLRV
ncbi:hypothetical protein THAOC_27952 [Thalassiosira oceanica]|uniref:Uncharacterized protein n=1 Tax=Thalassiosira oceanica TaxID=159749 RepID=K0RKE8_THAOC|nr:hypothetical protein THAOC_27952 [Thalassiosira oceanica]|eukprot:EJK52744.1 hypothetical protein THAOC_27952 [Thalassiosira oceanica]